MTAPALPQTKTVSGFQFHREYNDKILVFTVSDTSRQTIDAWITTTSTLVQNWPDDEPFFSLQDFSLRKTGPSPYSRAQAKKSTEAMKDKRGYIAVAMPKTITSQLLRLVWRGTNQNKTQMRVFANYALALAWLKEMVDAEALKSTAS